MIELRRAEGGIRTWAAEPGEYYHQTRRRSMAACGGATAGRRRCSPASASPARGCSRARITACCRPSRDPRFAWMFDGIEGDVIGDYGLSGGGAAGFELDRADPDLGTPGRRGDPGALGRPAGVVRHRAGGIAVAPATRVTGEPAEEL